MAFSFPVSKPSIESVCLCEDNFMGPVVRVDCTMYNYSSTILFQLIRMQKPIIIEAFQLIEFVQSRRHGNRQSLS